MERFMRFYQAVFMNETIGFFASEKKAMEKIFTMARDCWRETWQKRPLKNGLRILKMNLMMNLMALGLKKMKLIWT